MKNLASNGKYQMVLGNHEYEQLYWEKDEEIKAFYRAIVKRYSCRKAVFLRNFYYLSNIFGVINFALEGKKTKNTEKYIDKGTSKIYYKCKAR